MKKPVMLIFVNAMILIVVFALLAQSLFLVQRLAQASRVQGTVEVQRASRGDFVHLTTNQSVSVGDVVRTGSDGRAEFVWADKTRWILAPNSQLTVANATLNSARDVENSRFELDEGKLFVRMVKPLRAGSSFEVQTPRASAKVTGTVFSVEVMPSGATCIEAYAGQVQMESEGQQATVAAGTAGTTVAAGATGADSIEMAPISGADFRALPDLIRPVLNARAQKMNGANVWLRGETEAGDALEINGQSAQVLGNGAFVRRFALAPGHNQWQIVATDKHGVRSQLCRALNYDAKSGAAAPGACR